MKFVRFAFLLSTLAAAPAAFTANAPVKSASKSDATPPIAAKSEVKSKTDASGLAALRAKAEHGNAIAQYNLGLAYAQGRQGAADPIEAFMWLTLAAEGGSTGKALETVLNNLTEAQLADGRRRLESLRNNIPLLRAAPVVQPLKTSAAATVPAAKPSALPATATAQPARATPAAPATEESKHLYDQLASAGQEKRQLATDLGAARKENERLQAELANRGGMSSESATAQAQLKEARATLAAQSTELAAAQVEVEEIRTELAKLKVQLATTQSALDASSASATFAGNANTAQQRERITQAEAQTTLAPAKARLDEQTTAQAKTPAATAAAPAVSPTTATAAPTAPAARAHTVEAGETLSVISRQYYGTPNRWSEILAANRDVLREESNLLAGRSLRIP